MRQANHASTSFPFYHFFSFFFSQHLLNHTNTITSTWILCNRVILIDIPVGSTILASFYVLGDRSCKILKLAIIILNYIILKISYIYNFFVQLGAESHRPEAGTNRHT